MGTDLGACVAKVIPLTPASPVGQPSFVGIPSWGWLTDTIFVGREREMAALRAGLEDSLAGHGRLVLLAGEPGIGKTRTAHELATQARSRNAQVLIGRCYEGEGAPPFWPWVQIVRAYITKHDPEVIQAVMGRGAADIAQVIAEVREQVPNLPIPPVLTPEYARFCFFDSFVTFLKNTAKVQPLVLILDDLHWADVPSLLLLEFLARELEDTRLLVIGTYRDVSLSPQHPLTRTLGELVRVQGSQSILLQNLTKSDMSRFIELMTGKIPTNPVAAAIYAQTEGNPFFITEVVHLLIREGEHLTIANPQAAITAALPQRVREAISRRFQVLSEECHNLLTLASVIGREFSLRILEMAAAGLNPALPTERMLEVLDEAEAARLITPVPQSVGYYSFSHALIRETSYESLSTSQRICFHRKIGETIERLFSADLKPYFAELASHFFAASRGGDEVGKALTYTARAGDYAMTLLAYEEAATHYERALQALEFQAWDGFRRCELLLALGDAQRRAGKSRKARETFQQAAVLARTLKTRVEMSEVAPLLARAALGYGAVMLTSTNPDRALIDLLEEALSALGEEESALRAKLLSRLAMELYYSAPERCLMLSAQAVAMARKLGDIPTLATTLSTRRYAIWAPETLGERHAVTAELIQLGEELGHQETQLLGRQWRIVDFLEQSDITVVEQEIAAHARLTEELRQPLHRWYGMAFQVMRALMTGRLEEGERLAQEALASGQRVQHPQIPLMMFSIQMFQLRTEQGCLQELEEGVKDLVSRHPRLPVWQCALAYLYSELGREAEARRTFALLAANNFGGLPRDANWLIAVALLSETCTSLGDGRAAAVLYELLLPYAERNVVVGAAIASYGSVSYYLGLLATLLSRFPEATRHFTTALAVNIGMGARLAEAHTQHGYAALLLARDQLGDQEKAAELLGQALATAQELGMLGLVEKIRTLKQKAKGKEQKSIIQESRVSTAHQLDLPCASEAQSGESKNQESESRNSPPPTQSSVLGPQSSPVPGPQPLAPSLFRHEGAYWAITFQGATFRLQDIRGLHYLACLLRYPHKEFHVLDLVAAEVGSQISSSGESGRVAEPSVQVSGLGDAGEILDSQAKAAYKRRLEDLREELAEAQAFNDLGRSERTQQEIDFLTRELAGAVGLGGRNRRAAAQAERARVSVTRRIKAALIKIAAHDPSLEHYLATTIKTGRFCSYTPDPRFPISWQF